MDPSLKRFGWKRKIGAQVSKEAASAFEQEAKDEKDESVESGDVDWLTLAPLRKKMTIGLEDGKAKANRLVQEGTVLASSERYWEALKKWDEALQYTPADETIHEMKAQALMELCEVYPAVQSAKKAVEITPTWWIAYQTLGRAYLGMGEVRLAVQSFSRAVHLNPCDKELWQDDLLWAHSLFQKRENMEAEKEKALEDKKANTGVKIVEIQSEDSDDDNNGDSENVVDIYKHVHKRTHGDTHGVIGKLPNNYVQMRDLPP